jgi:hypothetical protein
MALKPKAGAAPRGGFEDEASPGVVAADAPAQDPVAQASVAAVTAVAVASASSRQLTTGSGFKDVFKAFENAIPVMDFGTLPRLVGTNGGIEAKLNGGKTLDLGREMDLSIISYRSQWTISPGDDSKEAKEFVKYSNDGVTIDSTGQEVNAYLEHLRTVEGYEDADKKRYVFITGIIDSAEGDKSLVGQVVEVSLSPQAVRDFEGYRFQRSAAIATGRASAEGAELVTVKADKRSGNGNNWTTLVVGGRKAA